MSCDAASALSGQVAACARKLGDGDLAALGQLFDVSATRTVRYAQTLTRNQEDAEDALQAAMIRVAKNPGCLSAAQYPWAYFLKIVRNEAMRILAKKKPSRTLNNRIGLSCIDPPRLEREEWRLQVHAALKRLPAEQAEVVVLKIWEEMTFLEISAVTGESANTVASRYRYALAKLQHSLQALAGEMV